MEATNGTDCGAQADRRGLRHPSGLTDAEWELAAPLIRGAKRGRRPRTARMHKANERDLPRALDRLPTAGATRGFVAQEHGLRLSLPPGVGGSIAPIQPALYGAVHEQAGQPDNGDHRH